MMNRYSPKDFDSLIIPNKNKFLEFFNKCKKEKNYNIGIIGDNSTCKTTIINLIIEDFLKDKQHIEKNKLIYYLNYFKDINLQDDNNEIHIFCKNNINSNKIIFIEDFDYFNESNQQFLKIYIDTYNILKDHNKIFFIIESSHKDKIKDIIKSKLNLFYLENFQKEQFRYIFNDLCIKKNITYDQKSLDYITNISNTKLSYILTFFIKIKLLNLKHIDLDTTKNIYSIFNFNYFDEYFNLIQQDKIKEAYTILIDLFKNGYDISDIYFYLYEYIKTFFIEEYFSIIELLCYYINEIYKGNHNKIMLILLTYDIKKKIHNIS